MMDGLGLNGWRNGPVWQHGEGKGMPKGETPEKSGTGRKTIEKFAQNLEPVDVLNEPLKRKLAIPVLIVCLRDGVLDTDTFL